MILEGGEEVKRVFLEQFRFLYGKISYMKDKSVDHTGSTSIDILKTPSDFALFVFYYK